MRRLRVWLGLRLDPRAGREKSKGKGLHCKELKWILAFCVKDGIPESVLFV